MEEKTRIRIFSTFLLLIAGVVLFSFFSMQIWGGKPEELPEPQEFQLELSMTIEEFGNANALAPELLKHIFQLTTKDQLQQTLQQTGLSPEEITSNTTKALALESEHASKNWLKIVIKFALWIGFLVVVFFQLKRGAISPGKRKILLSSAVVLFGVILGADPSPMGTVKDAIVLFGTSGAIFPPRLIAFLVMLVGGIILANKFLCSWGCQFGTLQDLIFRLNRDAKDRTGLLPQYKIPFVVSNTIRIAFLIAMLLGAFLWAIDIVELYDPFKIFNPAVLGGVGIVVIGLLLIASLFVYRPWCHFFCPFGLVGWLAEKISVYKIQVDYDACISCEACAKACPSTVMNAILKREQRTIPDCFACGNCIDACPVNAVHFQSGKRQTPPAGKFTQS